MPQYVIERDVPGAHTMTEDQVRELARASVAALNEIGPQIQWIQSYVTENKVYCVYLAPDEATIRRHAQRVGIPANRVAAVRRLMTSADAGL
jgi:uncharacterized protein DUF4242